MKEIIKRHVGQLFQEQAIKGFIALKDEGGHVGPHVFTGPEELDMLSLGDCATPGDSRYALVGLLRKLAKAMPGETFAILVRGCDERALRQQAQEDRVHPLNSNKVIEVGFSCPPDLAQACQCHKPWPDELVAGDKTTPAKAEEPQGDIFQRMQQWLGHIDRCVKCFGCRNVCPVCVCHECTVENEQFVPQRQLPSGPGFLVTRALHMADRCVYCGLCERACPADIPLRGLYKLVAEMAGQGGYLPRAPRPSLLQDDGR